MQRQNAINADGFSINFHLFNLIVNYLNKRRGSSVVLKSRVPGIILKF
jgi:hypothetical protein